MGHLRADSASLRAENFDFLFGITQADLDCADAEAEAAEAAEAEAAEDGIDARLAEDS